ncbi:hypothetical protein GGR55DRAFT_681611 [Xylaria sp. FL0064]|nr:hypothetical protein GGR55DRAFT_681611 [Xylaria sp. FL0064]
MTSITVPWTKCPMVSQYGLIRSIGPTFRFDTEFMEPYVGNIEWDGFRVYKGDDTYSSYSVSPRLNAYVIISVDLTVGDDLGARRLTEMRLRDMMVDNYLDADGDLRTWRYIGVNDITNDAARLTIENSFSNHGVDTRVPGSIQLVPDDSDFPSVAAQNPFLRCIRGLLRQYEIEMGMARIKRVIFISAGFKDALDPDFHLVVELCRPGEDGYPSDEVWNLIG